MCFIIWLFKTDFSVPYLEFITFWQAQIRISFPMRRAVPDILYKARVCNQSNKVGTYFFHQLYA